MNFDSENVQIFFVPPRKWALGRREQWPCPETVREYVDAEIERGAPGAYGYKSRIWGPIEIRSWVFSWAELEVA